MKETKKTFDKVHIHYDGFMELFGLYRDREMSKILELKGHERILDIGGGTGYLANCLIGECNEIYILDESEDMLSHVNEREGIHKILGNAVNMTVKSGSMDIVILSDIFHHIEEQEKLLDESFRVLKQGGKILIHDFDSRYVKTKLLRCFERILFGRLYFKTIDEVIELLEKRFRLIDSMKKGYYFMLLGEK